MVIITLSYVEVLPHIQIVTLISIKHSFCAPLDISFPKVANYHNEQYLFMLTLPLGDIYFCIATCLYNLLFIVSPVRSTYGGYYGLVVVTPPPPRPRPRPPRPQTLHRSHDNLKNPYRIASIFYM